MKLRTLSLLLIFAILLSIVPASALATPSVQRGAEAHVYRAFLWGNWYQFALYDTPGGVSGLYQMESEPSKYGYSYFGTVRGAFEQDGRTIALNYRSEDGKQSGIFWLRMSDGGKLILAGTAKQLPPYFKPQGTCKRSGPRKAGELHCGGAVAKVANLFGEWQGTKGMTVKVQPGSGLSGVTATYMRPKNLPHKGTRVLQGKVSLDGHFMAGPIPVPGKSYWTFRPEAKYNGLLFIARIDNLQFSGLMKPPGGNLNGVYGANTPIGLLTGTGVLGATSGPALTGQWRNSRDGKTTAFKADGTMGKGNFWRCVKNEKGVFSYLLNWGNGTYFAVVTLKETGKTLSGYDWNGTGVYFRRVDKTPVDLATLGCVTGKEAAPITDAKFDPKEVAKPTTPPGGTSGGTVTADDYELLKALYAKAILEDWADTPDGQIIYQKYFEALKLFRQREGKTASPKLAPPLPPPATGTTPGGPDAVKAGLIAQRKAAYARYVRLVNSYRAYCDKLKHNTPAGERVAKLALQAKAEYQRLCKLAPPANDPKPTPAATPTPTPVPTPAPLLGPAIPLGATGATFQPPLGWTVTKGSADPKNSAEIYYYLEIPKKRCRMLVGSVLVNELVDSPAAKQKITLRQVIDVFQKGVGKKNPILIKHVFERLDGARLYRGYTGIQKEIPSIVSSAYEIHNGKLFYLMAFYPTSKARLHVPSIDASFKSFRMPKTTAPPAIPPAPKLLGARIPLGTSGASICPPTGWTVNKGKADQKSPVKIYVTIQSPVDRVFLMAGSAPITGKRGGASEKMIVTQGANMFQKKIAEGVPVIANPTAERFEGGRLYRTYLEKLDETHPIAYAVFEVHAGTVYYMTAFCSRGKQKQYAPVINACFKSLRLGAKPAPPAAKLLGARIVVSQTGASCCPPAGWTVVPVNEKKPGSVFAMSPDKKACFFVDTVDSEVALRPFSDQWVKRGLPRYPLLANRVESRPIGTMLLRSYVGEYRKKPYYARLLFAKEKQTHVVLMALYPQENSKAYAPALMASLQSLKGGKQ